MDKHDVISALNNLAIDLGRTPLRQEFSKSIRGGDYKIKMLFGNYSALLHAAGLDPEPHKSIKLSNSIFERDIKEVIEDYTPREVMVPIDYRSMLIIGDTHFPFTSDRVLEKIYDFAKDNSPQIIIQMGDLYDMYAHSKFPRSHNVYTPKEEEELGRKKAEEMWKTLRKTCPKAECYQLLGNHDARPLKRTLESAPSLEHFVMKYMESLMSFEGVKTITDYRQELILDGIMFHHGYRSKLGDHRDYAHMNAVVAHTHKGGTVFKHIQGRTLWELNAGFVGDAESKALAYTAQKIHDQTTGFGWIDKFGPRFIPV